jgi:aspartate racemase
VTNGAQKVVGVLGGMGPDATVDFMTKVIALTPAEKDQDHVHMLVDHNPQVPNRQAAILDHGDDPGPHLAAMARRLETAGADFLVIACNTAYVFETHILEAVSIPLISIIDESVAAVGDQNPAANSVGVLATDGCLKANVYQPALQRKNLIPILPNDEEMQQLMHLISKIKAGDKGGQVASAMSELAQALVSRGAQAIIAACTEIPLVLDATMLDVPLISSTDVLAEKAMRLARGELPLPDRE